MIDHEPKPGEHDDAIVSSGAAPEKSSAYSGQPDDLHDLFGSASNDEEDPLAALRDDPNYSALIRDLEYIASQARLLFAPAEEAPSDEVWSKIKDKLAEEPGTPEVE
jgi:hypothetical protein